MRMPYAIANPLERQRVVKLYMPLVAKPFKPENKSTEYKPNMPPTELKDTVIPKPGGVQNPDQTRTTGANR
jgi:hypothetical protein